MFMKSIKLFNIIFLIVLILSGSTGFAKDKIIDITGRIKIYKIYKENHYFLNPIENCIMRYDKDLKFKSKINKKGEGPGEFPVGFKFSFIRNKICLSSSIKTVLYDLNGKIISEKRNSLETGIDYVLKGGNKIIHVRKFTREKNRNRKAILHKIKLFNKNNKIISDLLDTEFIYTPGYEFEAIEPYIDVKYCEKANLIYVSDVSKGYIINIFNGKGKKITKIENHEKERIKVNKLYKKKFLQVLLNGPNTPPRVKNNKTLKNQFKSMLHFPEYFPPFHSFYLDERGNVFIKTFKRDKDKVIFDKYSNKGKYLGKVKLTDKNIDIVNMENFTAFYNGYYYYVYVNNEGKYILHKEKLGNIVNH